MNAIIAIASTTLGEAVRRKVLLIILLIGVGLLVVTPGLQQLAPRQATTVLLAFGLGVIQMIGALVAVVLTINLIPAEIERRTIYTILSKPVQRHQFLLGKFFGSVATILMMMSLMTVVFLVVYFAMRHELPVNILQGPPLFFLQMTLLAAVAMFFSTFVSPIVNFFLSFGMYLVGNLANPLFQSLTTARDVGPLARLGSTVIHYVLPNFANYNVQNPLINPESSIGSTQVYVVQVTLYALVYVAILLTMSIVVFDRREV